nr:hypothetical protein CFP56_49735 [Quercus suber]
MGNVNLLELRLSDEESVIARKLLETFGGMSMSWTGNRARFSFWISKFRESKDVGNLPSITLLDDRAHFAWKPYSYVAAGFCCPNPFPNARPGSQDFGLAYHKKILNFLLITSPSYIPYPSGVEFDLIQYSPHKRWSIGPARWRGSWFQVGIIRGYATSNMQLYWRKVMSTFVDYVNSEEVDKVVIGPPLNEPSTNARLIPNTKAASTWATKQSFGFAEWRLLFNSSAVIATKFNVPAAASASILSPLKQYRRKTSASRIKVPNSSEESDESEETQSKENDFEDTAADFGKLLFLALVSSCVYSPNVLYSLGPTDEDIEIVDEGPNVTVTAGEIDAGMPSQEHTGKDPNATVTAGEAIAEDEENEKVADDFYPLSSNTIMFQWSEVPVEGQPLLEGNRKKLESANLKKALEWKNALKDLLLMKFGVQFILDKIQSAIEACIARDNENKLNELAIKIANLEKEIAIKTVELSLLVSQRDKIMQSSSTRGASSSAKTFGNGLLD